MEKSATFNHALLPLMLITLGLNTFISLILIRLTFYFFSNNFFFMIWVSLSLIISLLITLFASKQTINIWQATRHKKDTKNSVNKLTSVKKSGITLCIILIQLLPAVYFIADKDDAPGLILFFLALLLMTAILTVLVIKLLKPSTNPNSL